MANYPNPNHNCTGMYQYPGMQTPGMSQTPPWMQTYLYQNPYMSAQYPQFRGQPFGMTGFQGVPPTHPGMQCNHLGGIDFFNLFRKS